MRTFFKAWKRFRSSVSGNIAIVTGLALPVLVGFVGLGAETGYWYYEQRRLQAAVDLSAYAAAVRLRAGDEREKVLATAEAEAASRGFDPASGTVVVNLPPLSGSYQNARSVEVALQRQYPRTFSSILVAGDVPMAVRAVASYDTPAPACIIALHETRHEAMLFSGSARASFTGCDLMSNSLAADAITIQGSVFVTASCVSSAGGIFNNARLELVGCPEPLIDMPRAPDPYAYLTPPDIPADCSSVPSGPGAKTLQPGKYCGGMTLHGEVTLEPGTYVVSGGEMRINASANVVGEGVTFYLTDGAWVGMNGSAQINLTAPKSGPYQAVLFHSDKNNAGGEAVLNGTASSSLRGAVYFPRQHVALRGDFEASDGCMRIVALTIEVRGRPNFSTDCTDFPMGPVEAPGRVRLVE